MKKLTAEKCREQFEEWWESFYEIKPMEPWSSLYSPEHDYYVDEAIDGQYDAWKASRKALEIALPILEQQERCEREWIEWGGGDCPVSDSAIVEVRFRSGRQRSGAKAEEYIWTNGYGELSETGADIIAYRIIPERATNQNGEQ